MGELGPQQSSARSNGTKRMSFTVMAFLAILLLHIMVPVVSAKTGMSSDEKLTSTILGDIIESPDASKYLLMQNDGNVVVYQAGKPLWASNTVGSKGDYYLKLGRDGSLIVYRSDGSFHKELISFSDAPTGIWRLDLNNNGVLYLKSPDGKLFWTYHCRYYGTSFTSAYAMPRPYCITSSDSNNFLAMQRDGNVVIYKGYAAQSNWPYAMGKGGSFLKVNDMGALQVQDNTANTVIFNIFNGVSTSGKGPYTVRLTNDAKISIKNKDGKEVWSS